MTNATRPEIADQPETAQWNERLAIELLNLDGLLFRLKRDQLVHGWQRLFTGISCLGYAAATGFSGQKILLRKFLRAVRDDYNYAFQHDEEKELRLRDYPLVRLLFEEIDSGNYTLPPVNMSFASV